MSEPLENLSIYTELQAESMAIYEAIIGSQIRSSSDEHMNDMNYMTCYESHLLATIVIISVV